MSELIRVSVSQETSGMGRNGGCAALNEDGAVVMREGRPSVWSNPVDSVRPAFSS